MIMQRRLAIGLMALLVTACDTGEFAGPTLAPDSPELALTTVPGVTEVTDEVGPGATFALFKPEGWEDGTRELVVYAHGYVQPFLDPALPTNLDWFRDWLLGQGIAVAYSSYSHTGYAVKDGALRTHQLRGLFTDTFGKPAVVHLVGISMGAMVASLLEERYPSQYDGSLLLCGALGGGLTNAGYIADVRVLWDALFPGTLMGSVLQVPEGYLVTPGSPAYQAIVGTVLTFPERAAMLASMDPVNIPIDVTDPNELIPTFVLMLGYQINGANDLTDLLHGHSFYDNRGTWYSGSPDDEGLNAAVARYESDPDAVNYLDHWYTPTGSIDDPVVTLHTTRDPLVPGRVEETFARKVAEAGNASLLTRMPPTDAFGHCAFEGPDVIGAFLTLRSQVLAP